jgi:hypothetical protein
MGEGERIGNTFRNTRNTTPTPTEISSHLSHIQTPQTLPKEPLYSPDRCSLTTTTQIRPYSMDRRNQLLIFHNPINTLASSYIATEF